MVIVIGGPGGTGSSTIAKKVAEVLDCQRVYGGALMRWMAMYWKNHGDLPDLYHLEPNEILTTDSPTAETKALQDQALADFLRSEICQTGIVDTLIDDTLIRFAIEAQKAGINIVIESKVNPFRHFELDELDNVSDENILRYWVCASLEQRAHRKVASSGVNTSSSQGEFESRSQTRVEYLAAARSHYARRQFSDCLRYRGLYGVRSPIDPDVFDQLRSDDQIDQKDLQELETEYRRSGTSLDEERLRVNFLSNERPEDIDRCVATILSDIRDKY